MATRKWKDVQARRLTPEQIAASRKRAEREVLEMNLAAIRVHLGKTQAEIAELAQMTQGELSRAERRDDHLVSTLRKVIEALGGRLEVKAVFNGEEIELTGV